MSFLARNHGGRSTRNHFVEPPGLADRVSALTPRTIKAVLAPVKNRVVATTVSIVEAYSRERRRNRRAGTVLALFRLVFTLPNVLLLIWLGTLWWGERTVFRNSVKECGWDKWESWPRGSDPDHVVFIADPQLVDAHTYPGRPWPLSSLTVFYSDLYLYRTYSLLQQHLRPDATMFLGDLFDGGREWGTATSSSPDARYKDYGNDVWMKEYRRFSKLFIDAWKSETGGSDTSRDRKIIASLPGNHDLGFGTGIQIPVAERFRSFFGEGNRIDVIGNHTFVSVDSVSLSAMDQPDPSTGSSGSDPSGGSDMEKIWRPTADFLNNAQTLKGQAIQKELLQLGEETEKYSPSQTDAPSNPVKLSGPSDADFPTIVLTHVPFYREAGTPCGPLRENYPPSSTDPLPEKDDRNAIKITRGYQYQNVLTSTISKDMATKAGPVTQIYSGDDHDYCEIVHREFSGAPKEITVKSMSLAMGIRRPGFQMASLWNPVDPSTGKSTSPTAATTIQNRLCLLPDQISIFVQYAYVFVFTLLVLFIRALSLAFRVPDSDAGVSEPILPLAHRYADVPASSASASSSTASRHESRFASRSGTITSRTASNSPPHDTPGHVRHVEIIGASGTDDVSHGFRRFDADTPEKSRERPRFRRSSVNSDRDIPIRGLRRSISIFRSEFVSSMKRVCIVAFAWYVLLVWTW